MATATDGFVPANLNGAQIEDVQPLVDALINRDVEEPEALETLVLDRSELDSATSEAHVELYVSMTRHTDDEVAKKGYLRFVEQTEPALKKAAFELDNKVASSPAVSQLDSERYGVLLQGIRSDVEIFCEENIPLFTEDTKLGQEYGEIRGAMSVVFDGEERTLPQMGRYFEDTDRSVREGAWLAVAERRNQDRDRIDDIFDRMVQIRHQIGVNTGLGDYRSYMFRAMHRFAYTPKDCFVFHEAVEETCIPVLRKLDRLRASQLNLSELRRWDLEVDPHGREPLRPFVDASDLIERSSRVFHRMDSTLGKLFDSLREGDCLDLDSRMNKQPGGYQVFKERQRIPFIFMNAAGLHRDVETMVHEAGHAFHSLLSRDEPLIAYRNPPIEFAEVASMTMELTSFPYLDEFYTEEEASRAQRLQLQSLAKMLPWIATIDAFQHWIYDTPTHSRQEREEAWVNLEDRFGSALDWSGLEHFQSCAWHRQLHPFQVPFYYIEYGIAQLGALQLWLQFREDPERALRNYAKALSLGGSRPLPELFEAAGLEFRFDTEMMGKLMDTVGQVLTELPE